MTNEQKADEICKKHIFDSNHFDCCMEMADWKDKQFQKVLDYAEICYGVFSFEQRKNFINHIKQIFMGE